MNEYHLFYTEDRLDEDAPTQQVIGTFHAHHIDDAVAYTKERYGRRIQEDVEDDVEYELERATLTWTDPKGFEAYYVIETVTEEGSE